MTISAAPAEQKLHHQAEAARNEQFVSQCLQMIQTAPDPEEGLRRLLAFLGEALACRRVYVFEEMDRQHVRNTYEWCQTGVHSGIEQLPYVAKKDLQPWYRQLSRGSSIIEPQVERLRQSEPLLYAFLNSQDIHAVILSPLLMQGQLLGFLGADDPPPERLAHISVLFDVLAYFVVSLVSQRELASLRQHRAVPPKPMDASPRCAGKTLLLVDDSPELLRLNQRVLRPDGYTIHTASTLREARDLLTQHQPDAIVMDIDLPDGSGIDFCRELNQSAAIPVVLLTAHSDQETARQSQDAGCQAFLTKPYDLMELRETVSRACTTPC